MITGMRTTMTITMKIMITNIHSGIFAILNVVKAGFRPASIYTDTAFCNLKIESGTPAAANMYR